MNRRKLIKYDETRVKYKQISANILKIRRCCGIIQNEFL